MFEPTEPIRLFEKLSGKLIVEIFYAYIAKIIEFYVFCEYKKFQRKTRISPYNLRWRSSSNVNRIIVT